MRTVSVLAGLVLIFLVLRDAFETMILPRRLAAGRIRFTKLYYRVAWPVWSGWACRSLDGRKRESALSLFGPLSLLFLFACWAAALIAGFALIYIGLGSPFQTTQPISGAAMDFYLSGSTFFTLGLGDVVPRAADSRILGVIEAGMGFGFLAVIIGYLPVLYQAFSRREVRISMLDARAGSPPAASELLRRHIGAFAQLQAYLADWELWSAELLESQISYPVLGFFRSQHVNQSWLASLTTVLDSCALLIAATDESCARQAQLTFAMARHAVVDLAQIFIRHLPEHPVDRLPAAELARLGELLLHAGFPLRMDASRADRLHRMRLLYEPHVQAIAAALCLALPAWIGNPDTLDNWQRSPWDRVSNPDLARMEKTLPGQHF